jgi:hypothetical protein
MSSSRMTSSLRPSISPQEGRDVRARAWAFVFECYRKNEAATSPVSRPRDAERSQSDGASDIIQESE